MSILFLTTSILSLWLLFYCWREGVVRNRQSRFRRDMRKIRDELFESMLSHHGDFSDPAYRCLWDTLNSVMYLSRKHKLSFMHVVIASNYREKRERQGLPNPERPASLDPRIEEILSETEEQATARLVHYILLDEVFLACKAIYRCTKAITGAIAIIDERFSEIRSHARDMIEESNDIAYSYGFRAPEPAILVEAGQVHCVPALPR